MVVVKLHTAAPPARPRPGQGPVRAWLFGLCALIFAMILVGGATRLTGSGLSITEWQPIIGVIPPLSEADWQEAFDKYRQIPQYQLVNKGMTLDEFKVIYWWEWTHRFLGRLIGLAFLVPFLVFWLRGAIDRALMPKLLAMFVLGGLQGALGWYMVRSGLSDRVDVSQYRLAAHLGAAVLIYGYILWVALDLGPRPARARGRAARPVILSAAGLAALIFLQTLLGALVAGLDAGMAYSTWPLMDGRLVPSGLGLLSPWYLNPFENAITVQFNHRMGAYAVVLWALLHTLLVVRRHGEGPWAVGAGLLVLAVLAQAVVGIATLLAQVPLDLALAHQAGAVVVFTVALWHLHRLAPGERGRADVETGTGRQAQRRARA